MKEFDLLNIEVPMCEEKIKYLYVLELQNDKYYVGTSFDPKTRLWNHCLKTPKGSKFVKEHLPIKRYMISPLNTTERNLAEVYETLMTIELIEKKGGLDQVWGGLIIGSEETRLRLYKKYKDLQLKNNLEIMYYSGADNKDFNITYKAFLKKNL